MHWYYTLTFGLKKNAMFIYTNKQNNIIYDEAVYISCCNTGLNMLNIIFFYLLSLLF